MRYVSTPFLSALIFLFLLNSCTDKSTTNPVDDLIQVRIDLQSGFDGKFVLIEGNGQIIFNARLSESVPFAGLLATFTTFFPKGNNEMFIYWGLNHPFQKNSIEFILEDTRNCFIGLHLSDDKIYFQIQDSEFFYL
jgi:hypothetical protein